MIRGIGGIERKLREQDLQTDKNISESFRDLKQLIGKAKEMAKLAETIAKKLKEKGNKEISEDEAVLFRSDLLKLGLSAEVDDLAIVSKKNYAHKSQYYQDLAKSICKFIKPILEKKGGQMPLTDVYCTVNRARGLNLISADDLLHACYALEPNEVEMVKFDNGLIILQLAGLNQERLNVEVSEFIRAAYAETERGLSANQLSVLSKCSIFLARQRLVSAEQAGLICRDESIEGLAFYPNLFLSGPTC